MFDIQSKKKVAFMSALAEASHLVKRLGAGGENKKAQRLKAWRAVAKDFTWNRIVDLHRGASHARVSGDELNLLRSAAARFEKEASADADAELESLIGRVAKLEAYLLASDPDFHSAHVAAQRAAVARWRGMGEPSEGD